MAQFTFVCHISVDTSKSSWEEENKDQVFLIDESDKNVWFAM